MKKVLAIVSALVCVALIGKSQNNSLGKSDPDAKLILDKVSQKIKSYKSMQLIFTLKVEDAKGNLEGTKKGILYLKGNKYRVDITGQEIFCDGVTVWTYDKSSNEVTITKYDSTSSTMSPQKLFTDFYDKDFLYKLNGEQKMGTKSVYEIEMTPVDKTKNIFKVYLYVDKASKVVAGSKMLDKGGNKYSYAVNSLNGNAGLSDATFTFDKTKHPGVEEVDLRN
jgi:outer membrane lipoprotein carrier protein